MNNFRFVGTILKPRNREDIIKTTNSGRKQLRLMIRQNENNSAYVSMYGDSLVNGKIPVFLKNETGRRVVDFENRFDTERLSKISYASKYVVNVDNKEVEFIWKDDFMDYVYELLTTLPTNTIYEITGEYTISYVNGKMYNNFNIKTLKVNNSLRPEFTLKIELYYNYKSLDESDKKNKFILNSFIKQYSYVSKKQEYYPLKVEFVTNRFDFKNPADIEIIKHRKANMSPTKEEGYVKALWEAQYVRGAQLILPPLETLPKDMQFEIKNAGREIQEYMQNVVGEAGEFICLTRPDNTLSKNGEVYTSLNCTDNEFKANINEDFRNQELESMDSIAKKDAIENPFN